MIRYEGLSGWESNEILRFRLEENSCRNFHSTLFSGDGRDWQNMVGIF